MQIVRAVRGMRPAIEIPRFYDLCLCPLFVVIWSVFWNVLRPPSLESHNRKGSGWFWFGNYFAFARHDLNNPTGFADLGNFSPELANPCPDALQFFLVNCFTKSESTRIQSTIQALSFTMCLAEYNLAGSLCACCKCCSIGRSCCKCCSIGRSV